MTILDANILLYAYDRDTPQYPRVRAWLEQVVSEEKGVGLPWISIWAFARIATNPRLHRTPQTISAVCGIIRELLARPASVIVQPGSQHLEILERMAVEGQAAGPQLTDAALAALAVEHGAVLASTDRGFARFPGLKWVDPLGPAPSPS